MEHSRLQGRLDTWLPQLLQVDRQHALHTAERLLHDWCEGKLERELATDSSEQALRDVRFALAALFAGLSGAGLEVRDECYFPQLTESTVRRWCWAGQVQLRSEEGLTLLIDASSGAIRLQRQKPR